MKFTFLILFSILSSLSALGNDLADFPSSPDTRMTPGALCTTPSRHRYPENIAYCDRAVDRQTKEQVFNNYRRMGYALSEPRDHYKIDHFIPLCAGGSNDITNLWPQHSSIFQVTDDIEGLGCSKLSQGLIKQRDLIELIRKAKYDNKKAPEVLKYLYSL